MVTLFLETSLTFTAFLRNLHIKIRDTPNPNFLKFMLDDHILMKEGKPRPESVSNPPQEQWIMCLQNPLKTLL